MQELRFLQSIKDCPSLLGVVAAPAEFSNQGLLLRKMPFAFCNVAFGLSQVLQEEGAIHVALCPIARAPSLAASRSRSVLAS
jgi:hypothetical protein